MTTLASRLHRGHWYGWVFWGVAATFFLYEFFVRVMPSVILSDLSTELKSTPVDLSGSLSIYLWVYAPMQLVVGGLFDRFGAKFLLVGAAAIVGGGCLIFSGASGLESIGLARGMAGFGSAFAFVGAVYVATVWFPPSRLALIAGITTAVGMLGEVIGQTPMVDAVATWGWRDVVMAAGWAGVGVAVLLLLIIPPRPDWFHDRFTEEDETNIGILRGIATVLGNWKIWAVGVISAVIYQPLSVVAAMWGNTFMETAGGYTAEQASFATIMLAVGWLIGCPLAGMVSDRMESRRWPLIVGSVGGGVTMLLFMWPEMLGYTGLLTVMLIGGLLTSTQAVTFAVAMELSPKALRGTAIACTNFICMMLAAGVQVIIGWILTAEALMPNVHRTAGHVVKTADLLQDASPDQFRWAIAIVPALFGLSLILCFVLPETAPGRRTNQA
ncbi:MAG: MFS transporter [Phycisphaerales bacterium]|jgi:MFS family permease|nr:MFS transporter [Phycisphaerales bacterium]